MNLSTVRPDTNYEQNIKKKCTRSNLCLGMVLVLGFFAYIIIFGKALSYINFNDDGSCHI